MPHFIIGSSITRAPLAGVARAPFLLRIKRATRKVTHASLPSQKIVK